MSALLPIALLFPAAMVAACMDARVRSAAMGWLWLMPVPALAAALFASSAEFRMGTSPDQPVVLLLDGPRAALLGATALLWSLAGMFASATMADDPSRGRFAVSWLLSLTGCLGVFMAGDLVTFYMLFALVSLSAYGLVVHDGSTRARRAAAIYLALAVLGEAFLLIAFIRLAAHAPGESLRIDHVTTALRNAPLRDGTILLLLLGFGVKMGLAPLHGWLPIAHPAAPAAGSAVLSGAIIKTGVIGLLTFLPFAPSMEAWGGVLVIVGFVTAFSMAVLGCTQQNPKTILAYSSASQMGVTAAIIGAALGGDVRSSTAAALVVAFYALHHVLTKGALFLSTALVASSTSHRRTLLLATSTLLALSFAGLPLTGGAIVKLAAKPLLEAWGAGLAASLSGAASAMIMVHFVRRLSAGASASAATSSQAEAHASPSPVSPRGRSARALAAWAAVSLAAILAPWVLAPRLGGIAAADALSPAALWSALWPIFIGAGLALAGAWFRSPQWSVPEGDILIPAVGVAHRMRRWFSTAEAIDALLARWPIAGVAFLALIVTLLLLLQ